MAIFLNSTTKVIVRLKPGETYLGWRLVSVTARQATMQRDNEQAVLALSSPSCQIGTELIERGHFAASEAFQPYHGQRAELAPNLSLHSMLPPVCAPVKPGELRLTVRSAGINS